MYIFLYSFVCWWTFRLLPYLIYSKQCCYENWGVCIFRISVFIVSDMYQGVKLLDLIIVLEVWPWSTK